MYVQIQMYKKSKEMLPQTNQLNSSTQCTYCAHPLTHTHTHTHTFCNPTVCVYSMYIEHCCSVGMFVAKFLCMFDTFFKYIKLFIVFVFQEAKAKSKFLVEKQLGGMVFICYFLTASIILQHESALTFFSQKSEIIKSRGKNLEGVIYIIHWIFLFQLIHVRTHPCCLVTNTHAAESHILNGHNNILISDWLVNGI